MVLSGTVARPLPLRPPSRPSLAYSYGPTPSAKACALSGGRGKKQEEILVVTNGSVAVQVRDRGQVMAKMPVAMMARTTRTITKVESRGVAWLGR